MLLRFDASLGGVSLAQLAPEILLQDIIEDPAEEDTESAKRAIHAGTRMTYRTRRKLPVRLVCNIMAYDPVGRAALMDKVAAWMGDGGWLTLSTRPNQRLYVRPDRPPAMGSSLRWTDDITLTLAAWERPYWESRYPVTATITDTGTITVTGTLPEACVEVDAINAGEADLTTITMTSGDTSITLTGLTVPPGERVTLSYTDTDVLRITAAGASALSARTAASHDDLIARTRQATAISVTADQPVSATFSARGRYW